MSILMCVMVFRNLVVASPMLVAQLSSSDAGCGFHLATSEVGEPLALDLTSVLVKATAGGAGHCHVSVCYCI